MEGSVDQTTGNGAALEQELTWLREVIQTRVALHFGQASRWAVPESIPVPHLDPGSSLYASFIDHYSMRRDERLAIALALAPHIRPQLLDPFFQCNDALGRGCTEFGGIQGRRHGGFLPTGETLLFLLAGTDLCRRIDCQRLFDRDHLFARHHILRLDSSPAGEPLMSGQLLISDEIIDLLTTGQLRKPDYSRDFPAVLIDTQMEWEDLVLGSTTMEQMRELEAWVRYETELMNDWGLAKRLRPGYRCLFYGPSGGGKTCTASVLGKRVERDVYRIALSSVVSKYIGETEKNLERIFSRAENMNCILFFDEADALFGKRTSVSDAHDRYANQEISYLLQRVEDFSGVVILASNYIGNIDEAFMRRFQAVVHFPMPSATERRQLWSNAFSARSALEEALDLNDLAERFELSGGAIMNAVRYASLMALEQQSNIIRKRDLISGIRRELQKDGKTL